MLYLPLHVAEKVKRDRIRVFRAGDFTFRIGWPGRQYKIFKVVFDRDGSIYMMYPYFLNAQGIVGIGRVPPKEEQPGNVNLEERGKVTTHLVKLSHHETGKALFSLDGKALSGVRRDAVPLKDARGHLATVKIQGLEGFEYTENEKTESSISSKKQVLTFNLTEKPEGDASFALKLYLVPRDKLDFDLGDDGYAGPRTNLKNKSTGEERPAYLLSPPHNTVGVGRILIVAFEKIPPLSKEDSTVLTMIGGFSPLEKIISGESPSEFLGMIYPVSDYSKLLLKIGTIDRSIQ